MSHSDDELVPEGVAGYVVGEKKTIDEYQKLDAEDESLAKWKASLGLSAGNTLPVAPGDKRKVVITEIAIFFNNEAEKPIIVNLENESATSLLDGSKFNFKIKERSVYVMRVRFKIQHEIVTGMRYLQQAKKAGITVDKLDEPCGSFAPNTTDKPYYEKVFEEVEAPGGIMGRGSLAVTAKFIDDDKNVHMTAKFTIQITK
ncbi:hypothetical protein BABINDRAFT_162734 [Babjeviella inositovora NRRL Y-12698]|uniref:Rho GDP-dissociation inhibitor n=1 Tax=Babjeviella inositovora NRRL Y-12698 TaxID=984486 RepID=A0A1E3QLN5_9ASCO|nr:uncharacterized protein BABINDRAFT_162734 [Babjeviella inositovora NRRL Y-12698]ODQ78528.1 hypothetical protein BABINDRAFT_162734 [Babjeviella inositovora NRRL Y-12698]